LEKEHIEQTNAQKFRFFTNVSHEFRTPLTLIMGQIEVLLMRQDIAPSIYNRILSVYRNTQRLKNMVDEIIDIRRLDQSRLRLHVARENLTSVAKGIWLLFHDYAVQRGVEFLFTGPETPLETEFDRRQLEKVLDNLLSNAFKYTASGGKITMNVIAETDEAVISIADTGVGIAPENLDRIFERFWQDEQANAAVDQYGSGIGLSQAKNLIEMHGGRIAVESEPGKGSVFSIHLPRSLRRDDPNIIFIEAVDKQQQTFLEQELSEKSLEPDSEKVMKILIVEDSAEMTEMLCQIFEPLYEVHTAANGADGLRAARTIQPDLVLSDIMMPVLSGFEMCKQLKSGIETSHIPVV
ncbi:MAG: hybrid sensor histidine kinase/response regulator, partial [Alistipes sp.]|nr:hybrid sensor histidine kinase/response regulator [Alistipes sp.]